MADIAAMNPLRCEIVIKNDEAGLAKGIEDQSRHRRIEVQRVPWDGNRCAASRARQHDITKLVGSFVNKKRVYAAYFLAFRRDNRAPLQQLGGD
jgi:hypothetical protein